MLIERTQTTAFNDHDSLMHHGDLFCKTKSASRIKGMINLGILF